jgi:hypothetical protein
MVFNVMKRPGIYIIVGLLFLTAFSETLLAVENYISPATIPPSSRREGLIRSPGAIDGSGNLQPILDRRFLRLRLIRF